jgi:hypothetical protein
LFPIAAIAVFALLSKGWFFARPLRRITPSGEIASDVPAGSLREKIRTLNQELRGNNWNEDFALTATRSDALAENAMNLQRDLRMQSRRLELEEEATGDLLKALDELKRLVTNVPEERSSAAGESHGGGQ